MSATRYNNDSLLDVCDQEGLCHMCGDPIPDCQCDQEDDTTEEDAGMLRRWLRAWDSM